MLKLSPNTLANYERRGMLHPQHVYRPDKRGIEHRTTVYDPRELAKLPRQWRDRATISPQDPGEVAARCFELFDQGKSLREVVVELRETPETIHALRDKWLDMGGADLVISPSAKESLEAIVGTFENIAELIEKVRQLQAP